MKQITEYTTKEVLYCWLIIIVSYIICTIINDIGYAFFSGHLNKHTWNEETASGIIQQIIGWILILFFPIYWIMLLLAHLFN